MYAGARIWQLPDRHSGRLIPVTKRRGDARVNLSEIAQFRQRQAAEEASAQLALGGLAITASHEAIRARMERGAGTLFQLFQQGRSEEAYALWEAGILERNTTNWEKYL